MNSYVEVTVILGTILNGSVWLTSAWLCRRPVRLRRILRFLLEFGLMKLWRGSLVHFQLFLPASCWQWTIAAGVLLMWDFILQRKLGQGLAETAFLYPVTLQAGDCELALSGYLDSLYQQNPAAVGGTLPADEFYFIP